MLRSAWSSLQQSYPSSCEKSHNSHNQRAVLTFCCDCKFPCGVGDRKKKHSSYAIKCSPGMPGVFWSVSKFGGSTLLCCVPSLGEHPPFCTMRVENRVLSEFLGVLWSLILNSQCHKFWTVCSFLANTICLKKFTTQVGFSFLANTICLRKFTTQVHLSLDWTVVGKSSNYTSTDDYRYRKWKRIWQPPVRDVLRSSKRHKLWRIETLR